MSPLNESNASLGRRIAIGRWNQRGLAHPEAGDSTILGVPVPYIETLAFEAKDIRSKLRIRTAPYLCMRRVEKTEERQPFCHVQGEGSVRIYVLPLEG
jgi:hypothetical protein